MYKKKKKVTCYQSSKSVFPHRNLWTEINSKGLEILDLARMKKKFR